MNYVRLDKGKGVRVTLTTNGWAGLVLCVGYFASDMIRIKEPDKLKGLMPYLPQVPMGPRASWAKRGRKMHKHIPPSQVDALILAMKLTMGLKAGFIESVQANVHGAVKELEALSVVDLLAAVGED